MSRKVPTTEPGGSGHAAARAISHDSVDAVFKGVGQKLREGHSGEAEKLLTRTIADYDHDASDLANLKRLLSFTLETTGRYKEALEVVRPYENEENRKRLSDETQTRVATQLAIAFSNAGDQPKAITLLKDTLQNAEANDELAPLRGSIEIALARVYRKLSEYPIGRDHAQRALAHFRTNGDWLGMAEAYREIANSLHQEGNSEKALEYFELGIKIIGNNLAPFMLGKLYTDMSGAYWFLRRPQDGIECLEKSIRFFDQTEHVLNTVIAYNNLGINLMLIGEWHKAEEIITRALGLAEEQEHSHAAGILDSLGELKILRGELADAEELLERAIKRAKGDNRAWYEIQSMRNLARCYLAEGKYNRAVAKAEETIEYSRKLGDSHFANMASLVVAESCLRQGGLEECEDALRRIEEGDPASDFYVFGNIPVSYTHLF